MKTKSDAKKKTDSTRRKTDLKEVARAELEKLRNKINTPEKRRELKESATSEYKKVRKQMDVVYKKIENYMKKNPQKAKVIAAGINTILVAAITRIITGRRKK